MMKYHLDRMNRKIYILDTKIKEVRFFHTGKMGLAVLGESEKYYAFTYARAFKYGLPVNDDSAIDGMEWHDITENMPLPIVSARLDEGTYVAYLRLMYEYHSTSELIRDAINALMEKTLEGIDENRT